MPSFQRRSVSARPRRALLLVTALSLGVLVGCTDSRLSAQASTAVTPKPSGGEASEASQPLQDETAEVLESESPDTAPTVNLCDGLEVRTAGIVANPELIEASGIAASQQHPGVFWAHNDSGSQPTLYAIGSAGEDLGSFPVPGIAGIDVEDIALLDGSVYLADIGDNNERRSSVFVYRFDEPVPGSGEGIGPVATFEFVYPDGAHDAESFLVDPISRDLVILDKSFRIGGGDGGLLSPSPARIFVTPAPSSDADGAAGEPITMEQVGTVAVDELALRATAEGPEDALFTQLGLGGLATGASIRNDGGAIAVRTYATVWLFDRSPGQSIAEALGGVPCEAPTLAEQQGEAVDFLPGTGSGFVTVSEGSNPGLNVTEPRPR